mmetsp:Transcript_15468/g.23025  ORF Transcript_15468/g.23025 Transcript_15468/m.23025 type:complete len:198 (+) Transcript_15468:78-671(+)|eukprot:CAMPEP_0171452796 /NCGR_PEP_ID=MMETSP0945-20130129/759_1 /TAXON_ID=109269 /ORGANISM="Vaucheria litorea, Strain CCMP2940" /LENGTH=197 /DNA_ID=CAMNT_0011977531 /DNA_START=78 /DNA_END=671 /DNA_ORIENTATION=-
MGDGSSHSNQVAKRKLALLGITGVGKTSLATRFVQRSFKDTYNPTIANTYHTDVKFGSKILATEILDTAGMDGSNQIPRHASVGVHGYILLYSTISKHSFKTIININEDLMHELAVLPDVPKVLVGTMNDLTDQRQVSPEQGKALAQELGIPFLECSAKENFNIDAVFESLIKEVELAQGGAVKEETPPQQWQCTVA